MPQFSRRTVLEACNLIGEVFQRHAEFEGLMMRWELDEFALVPDRSLGMRTRCLNLFRYLRDNPEVRCDGQHISDLVVEEAAIHVFPSDTRSEAFLRALERDGYTAEHQQLRRALPVALDLPVADDEVHKLLDRHNLLIPKGHLDQAIENHQRGNWAAANSQLRTFYESLFDEIALLVDPQNASQTQAGEGRRRHLANLAPPFLIRNLNEWSDDGKNFVNGIWKRLHPQGAHPGLSDDEDCTFRLHLVLLNARLFLRRLDAIINTRNP
jgi:hypothetical protein